jgi:hypothetical protein
MRKKFSNKNPSGRRADPGGKHPIKPAESFVRNLLAAVRSNPAGFDRLLDAMQFDANYVILMNNLAWSFATYPDPKLRNGKHAVRLAARACEMTGYQNTICMETLAAVYAEDSRFNAADVTAQLACSLATAAGQPDLLKKKPGSAGTVPFPPAISLQVIFPVDWLARLESELRLEIAAINVS